MSAPLVVPNADRLRMPKPLSCWSVTVLFQPEDEDVGPPTVLPPAEEGGPPAAKDPICGIVVELGVCQSNFATP